MNVFEIFAKIGLDRSAYDKGLDDAQSKGSSFASNLSGTFGKVGNVLGSMAKVGVAAFAAIGTASAAVTSEFVRGATDIAAYGDNIDKMSQKMGLSAEAYQEWDAIMQHSGTSIESMQSGMKTLANAVENGNKAFERLGMTQEQIASMSQEELFAATISSLQNVEDTTERTYLAGQLLGRGATELGALLNMSAEETEEMRQRVHELGGVMSDDAIKASAQFQDNLQDLQTALAGTKKSIMADLLPGLNMVLDGFTRVISGEEGAEDLIENGVDSLLGSIDNGIDKAIEIGEKILPKIGESIIKHLPQLLQNGATIVGKLGSAIISNAPQLIKTGTSLLAELIQGLAESLPEGIAAALDVVFDIIDAFTDPETMSALIDAGLELMVGLVEGMINAIPVIIERLPEIIDNIVTTLIDEAPRILEAVSQINDMLYEMMMEYGPKLLEWLIGVAGDLNESIQQAGADAIAAVVDWLSQLPGKMAYWAGYAIGEFLAFMRDLPGKCMEFFNDVIQKVVEFGANLVENGPTIASEFKDNLLEWLADLPDKFLEIGGNIVDGLWNGIKDGWDWLTKKAKELAEKLVGGVKDALGIESPSKEFAWIGKMVDEGFAQGVKQNEDIAQMQVAESLGFENLSTNVGSASEVATAMSSSGSAFGGSGGQDSKVQIELVVKPDEKRFFKEMQRQGTLYQDASGRLVFGEVT